MERITAGDTIPNGRLGSQPLELEDEYTFDDFLTALYRQRGIILFVALSAALFSGLIGLLFTPQYEAKATFYVPKDVTGAASIFGTSIETSFPQDSQKLADANAAVLRGKDAMLAIQKKFPDVPYRLLKKRVDVATVTSGLITVYVRDTIPDRAAKIANAFVQYFNDFVQSSPTSESALALERLNKELQEADRNLLATIQAKKDFLEKNKISSPQTELVGLQQRSLSAQYELRSAQVQREALGRQIDSLEKQMGHQAGVYSSGQLREQVAMLRAEREATDAKIRGQERLIEETQGKIQGIAAFAAEVERLEGLTASSMDSKRSLEQLRNNLGLGTLQTKQVGLLVETASAPGSPVFPVMWLNVVVGGTVGLLVGALYVLALEGLAARRHLKRLREGRELERWFGPLLEPLPAIERGDPSGTPATTT